MESAPEIFFRDVKRTEALEDLINEKIKNLENFSDSIISCRVAVQKPQSLQRSGKPYEVKLTVRVPGQKEVVVNHSASKGAKHEDIGPLISETFDAAERQLKKFEEKKRRDVKVKADQTHLAQISHLYPEEGYGYLSPADGNSEIYFDNRSLPEKNLDELTVGTIVTYEEEMGERGLWASHVKVTKKFQV